jgi:hypothetical protein
MLDSERVGLLLVYGSHFSYFPRDVLKSQIGTQAAAAQATIGNVVAPGMFATLTSAGAGGYGVAAIAGTVQWAGGTMMGLAGAAGTWLTAGKGAGH